MKEKYEKPQILFEDMRLNTAVAMKCSFVLKPDGTFVPWDNRNESWSFIGESTCDGGEYTEFCYHNPNEVDVLSLHDVS